VKRADDLLHRAVRWERRSCGYGSKGERYYDWAFFTVTLPDEPAADGFVHTLLIRRSTADPTQIGYFLVHAPTATPVKDMVAVAGIRWRIEECNEQSKDLLGLDQHQVRTWTAFHHHVAVCLFAHAFAATRRAHCRPDRGHRAGAGQCHRQCHAALRQLARGRRDHPAHLSTSGSPARDVVPDEARPLRDRVMSGVRRQPAGPPRDHRDSRRTPAADSPVAHINWPVRARRRATGRCNEYCNE
jgi:hypothetical protein